MSKRHANGPMEASEIPSRTIKDTPVNKDLKLSEKYSSMAGKIKKTFTSPLQASIPTAKKIEAKILKAKLANSEKAHNLKLASTRPNTDGKTTAKKQLSGVHMLEQEVESMKRKLQEEEEKRKLLEQEKANTDELIRNLRSEIYPQDIDETDHSKDSYNELVLSVKNLNQDLKQVVEEHVQKLELSECKKQEALDELIILKEQNTSNEKAYIELSHKIKGLEGQLDVLVQEKEGWKLKCEELEQQSVVREASSTNELQMLKKNENTLTDEKKKLKQIIEELKLDVDAKIKELSIENVKEKDILNARIAELEETINNLRIQETELKKQIDDQKTEVQKLEFNNKDLKKQETELKEKLDQQKTEIQKLEASNNDLRKQGTELKEQLDQQKAEIQKLEVGNDAFRKQETELKKQIDQQKSEIRKLEASNHDLKKHGTELKVQLDEQKAEIEKLEAGNNVLKKQETELKRQLDEQKAEIQKLEVGNNDLKKQETELKGQLDERKAEIQQLEVINGDLRKQEAELRGQLDEKNAEIRNLESSNNDLKKQVMELKGQLEEQKAAIQKLEGSNNDLRKQETELQGQLNEQKAESQRLELSNNDLRKQENELKVQLDEHKSGMQELEANNNDLKKQENELKEQLGEQRAEIQKLEAINNDIRKQTTELKAQLEKQDEEIQKAQASNNNLKEGNSNHIASLEVLRKNNEQLLEEVQNYRQKSEMVAKLETEMNDLKSLLASKEDQLRRNEQLAAENLKSWNDSENQFKLSLAEKDNKVSSLETKCENLESNNAGLLEEVETARKELTEKGREIKNLHEKLNELEEEMKRFNEQSKALTENFTVPTKSQNEPQEELENIENGNLASRNDDSILSDSVDDLQEPEQIQEKIPMGNSLASKPHEPHKKHNNEEESPQPGSTSITPGSGERQNHLENPLIDPRSPTVEISRTPITVEENMKRTKLSKRKGQWAPGNVIDKENSEVGSLKIDEEISKDLDPRSPSYDINRTPLGSKQFGNFDKKLQVNKWENDSPIGPTQSLSLDLRRKLHLSKEAAINNCFEGTFD